MHFPPKLPCGDGTLQKRKHWKLTGRAPGKELRPVHTNPGVSQPIGITFDNVVAVDTKVTTRVVCRVRHEDEMPGRTILQREMAVPDVTPRVTVNDEKRTRSQQGQRLENAAARLE